MRRLQHRRLLRIGICPTRCSATSDVGTVQDSGNMHRARRQELLDGESRDPFSSQRMTPGRMFAKGWLMTTSEELIALEKRGWEALATSGEAAADFYRQVLDDDIAMVFPGGISIFDRDAVIESMGGEPWSSFDLSDIHVLMPVSDVGIVTYRSTSQRGDQPPYVALITSLYTRRGDVWRLTLHQQTAV
jgi:hypothetical protein